MAGWLAALMTVIATCPACRLAAQVRPTDIEAGIYAGARVSRHAIDQERLGGVVVVPFFGPAEFVGSLGVYVDFPGVEGYSGAGWETFLTVGARPLGRHTPLAIGYGVAGTHGSVESARFGGRGSSTEWSDAGLLGIEIPLTRIRPFTHVYLVNLLNRGSDVTAFFLLGFNVVQLQ